MAKSKCGTFKSVNRQVISTCKDHEILEHIKRTDKNSTGIRYTCHIHNQEVKQDTAAVYSKGCKFCFDHSRYTKRIEHFMNRLKDAGVDNDFELLSEYKSAKENIKLLHHKCGKITITTPDKFLRNCTCLYCSNPMLTINNINDYITQYGGFYNDEGFDILSDKLSKKLLAKTMFEVKHRGCGNVSKTNHQKFYNAGSRCRYCNSNNSRVHSIVEAVLYVNNIDYEVEYRFDDCKNKYALPFDFRINKRDGSFILVEVDGQQHHDSVGFGSMSTESHKNIKLRDKIKNEYCKANHITLIRIDISKFTSINEVYEHMKTFLEIIKKPNYTIVDKFNQNKINSKMAENVRLDYVDGIKMTQLSEKYDIDQKSILNILNYKLYSDILRDKKGEIDKIRKMNLHKPPTRDFKLLPYKEEVLKLRADGLTYKKIANIYKVSASCVGKFIVNNS